MALAVVCPFGNLQCLISAIRSFKCSCCCLCRSLTWPVLPLQLRQHHCLKHWSDPISLLACVLDMTFIWPCQSHFLWPWHDWSNPIRLTTCDIDLTLSMTLPFQTAQHLGQHPEKRTPIAQEILASEIAYMRTLMIIKNIFYTPLKAALASNRGIMSTHNMQIVFTDPLILLQLSM